MIDPRPAVIAKRFSEIHRIIAVTGGKGGIGKSTIATVLALTLAREGRPSGLLDLDLTGPCGHLFLGGDVPFPKEEHGLVPERVHGVRFLSVAHFTGEKPTPMRGGAVTDAIIELLSITRWPGVEALVIDMPPGLGDATLDLMRLLPGVEYLVLSTPSAVVRQTVRRTLEMLRSGGAPVLGVLENMAGTPEGAVRAMAMETGVPYLGAIPPDPDFESVIGHPRRMVESPVGSAVRSVHPKLWGN